MRRITCRVGDVPRTCCETQSSPHSPPVLPILPFSWVAPGDAVATMELRLCSGSPGRTLSSSMVDHSRIPWFFTWETWAITWVSPESHLITWVTADSDHRPPVTTRPIIPDNVSIKQRPNLDSDQIVMMAGDLLKYMTRPKLTPLSQRNLLLECFQK